MGPTSIAGIDAETILRNYEIHPVSSKPTVSWWVPHSFGLNKRLQFFTNSINENKKKVKTSEKMGTCAVRLLARYFKVYF
jgi:hypothetical protein